jgi:TldD protein
MTLDYEKIFKKLTKNGCEHAEVYHEEVTSTIIQKEAGRFEKLQTGTDAGLGIRLIKGHRTFYSFTNFIDQKSIEEHARELSSLSVSEKSNIINVLPGELSPVSHQVVIPPKEKSVEDKIRIVERADSTAKKYDSRIVSVNVNYIETEKRINIFNLKKEPISEIRTYTTLLVHVVATDGRVIETGYNVEGGLVGFELFEQNPPEEIALNAVRQAISLLSAPYAPAGKMVVVLGSDAGGTMIHEAVGHGLEADHVQDKSSIYAGKKGEMVASPLITVVDDPTIPNKRGSYTHDDEGIPGQRKVLIEKGILKDFMYDVLTAMRDGKSSNGNGRRESYRHRPIPRMSNTLIAPGEHDPDEIIRSVEKGLYVKKMGGGEVNTLTGDFVFHVMEGYRIEKGKIGEMVKGATITGNGPEILKSIDMVGNDLGFGIGTCGKEEQGVPVADAQPTLRVPEMIVGGIAE